MRLNFELLNVTDEVIDGEAKYNVYDENGKLLHANCSINLNTNVINQGTFLNKNLFDKLDRLIEYTNSREIGEDLPGYGAPANIIVLNEPYTV